MEPSRAAYRIWAPVYDLIFAPALRKARQRTIALLDLRPGERVLLSGVGTGLDLPLLPEGVEALGVDISEPMLKRARSKRSAARVELRRMDAQALEVNDGSFDAALLNLIVSVAPDGARVLSEARRAVRPGGRIAIFDKFLPEGRAPSVLERTVGAVARRLGTDPNRTLSSILAEARREVVLDEPSLLRGRYRIVLLRKG